MNLLADAVPQFLAGIAVAATTALAGRVRQRLTGARRRDARPRPADRDGRRRGGPDAQAPPDH